MPKGISILDNKGNIATHNHGKNGILMEAFQNSQVTCNLDNLDQVLYPKTPECFYKDIDRIYKRFDKNKDIDNEKIKAKDLIMAWQLRN